MITEISPDLLHPLPTFFDAAKRPLPAVEVIDASKLPPKAFRLLAHAGDMTSKLEEFFADEMTLQILQLQCSPEYYRREVVLRGAARGMAAEYGAIDIKLMAFPQELHMEIVEGKIPLGGLLNRHGMRYRSEPRGFLRIAPNPWLAELFGLRVPVVTYGRANTLLDHEDRELACIVEIIPPVDEV